MSNTQDNNDTLHFNTNHNPMEKKDNQANSLSSDTPNLSENTQTPPTEYNNNIENQVNSSTQETIPNHEIEKKDDEVTDLEEPILTPDPEYIVAPNNLTDNSTDNNTVNSSLSQEETENIVDTPTQENIENNDPHLSSIAQEVIQEQNNTQSAINQTNTPPTKETKQSSEVATQETVFFADKLFNIFSKIGLPVLLLLTVLLCGQQILFPRDFWFAEEVRFADIYMNLFSSNNFLMLTLNGQPYAETGPLFYFLVRFIDLMPTINMPLALFITNLLCSLFFVASTWLFARGLGLSKKIAFSAGLILLSCLFLASQTYYINTYILFASFLNLSYLCFYRAWKKESAPIWLIFAFLFLALASLSQLLLIFVLPFIASLLFFIWTNKFKRINSADGILGFLLAILLFFAWFGYIYMQGKAQYISLILNQQILQLFALPNFNTISSYYWLLAIPLLFLPFTFAFIFADWINWFKNAGKAIKNRQQENATAWLFILFICHLALFIYFSQHIALAIPMFTVLAILVAKIIMNFSPLRHTLFFSLTGIFTLLIGFLCIVSEFQTYIFKSIPMMQDFLTKVPFVLFEANAHSLYGFAAMGCILLILGATLFMFMQKNNKGGTLLVYCIGIIVAFQPVSLLITPQISSVLSPKKYAYEMATYKNENNNLAVPVTLGIAPETFTYYYNEKLDSQNYQRKIIDQLSNTKELTDFILNNETVILAIPEQEFNTIPYKDEAKILPAHQYIGTKKILLTVWQISSQRPLLNSSQEENKEIIPPINDLLEKDEKNAIINVQPNDEQNNNNTQQLPENPQLMPTDQPELSTTDQQMEIAL